jgi:hypothetical protein
MRSRFCFVKVYFHSVRRISSQLASVANYCRFLQEPHGVTSQKTPFFMVTAVYTSNLTCLRAVWQYSELRGDKAVDVRTEVLTVVTVQNNMCRHVTQCSLTEVCWRFGGTYSLHLQCGNVNQSSEQNAERSVKSHPQSKITHLMI